MSKLEDALWRIAEFSFKIYMACKCRTKQTPASDKVTLYPDMLVAENDCGERVIYDGEALDYECKDCGHNFERLLGYGGCCPSEYSRKLKLEKSPTVCPKCNSQNVKRLRSNTDRNLRAKLREQEGLELEECED